MISLLILHAKAGWVRSRLYFKTSDTFDEIFYLIKRGDCNAKTHCTAYFELSFNDE